MLQVRGRKKRYQTVATGLAVYSLVMWCMGILTGSAMAQKATDLSTASPHTTLAVPVKVTTIEGVTEYRLGNGLRVLLCPDPSRPVITVNMVYLVGSRHEGRGEAGMAHLLEHLLTRGTRSFPSVRDALVERGADFNATTWFDRTHFYETLAATDENLEFALRLEAERMTSARCRGTGQGNECRAQRVRADRE